MSEQNKKAPDKKQTSQTPSASKGRQQTGGKAAAKGSPKGPANTSPKKAANGTAPIASGMGKPKNTAAGGTNKAKNQNTGGASKAKNQNAGGANKAKNTAVGRAGGAKNTKPAPLASSKPKTSGNAKAPRSSSASSSASRQRTARGAMPPEKGGLSGGTVLLLLITLVVLIGLVILLVPLLGGKSNTTSSNDLPSSETLSKDDGPSSPLPAIPVTQPGKPSVLLPSQNSPSSNDFQNSPSPSITPTPSKTPEPTPTPSASREPSPTPTPSPSPTPTPTPTPEPAAPPYLKAVTDADRKEAIISLGLMNCTVSYYTPTIVFPGNEEVQSKVNQEVERALSELLDAIKKNHEKNSELLMMIGGMDQQIKITFYQSEHTVSLLFYYTIVAGKGDPVEECRSVNFNVQTGDPLTVFDQIKDRKAVVDYITSNLDSEEEPDLAILDRQPGTGGAALCHAWYIDQNTLTVVYNGKTIHRSKLTVTEIHILDRSCYNV